MVEPGVDRWHARDAGYALGWDPVIGDQPVMREIKTAIASTGLVLYDILSYYLQADFRKSG
jgi:hypothetical protein